jgi:hypothetical protein
MRVCLTVLLLLSGLIARSQEDEVSVLGQSFPPVEMHSVNAGIIDLASDGYSLVALVFVCNHCPMAKLYWERINQAYVNYLPKKVLVVAVNPMDTLLYKEECVSEMRKRVRASHLSVPYVQDSKQSVAGMFHVPHTPHVVLLAKSQGLWQVIYEGAFDDNGANPKLATPYLLNAIDEQLAGKEITVPKTQSFGCRVYYREP